MVDLSGDGLEFVRSCPTEQNAVGIAAGYDITGDGEVGATARLAPNDDDAFLVTWDGNSVTPTLLTEYLDPDRI